MDLDDVLARTQRDLFWLPPDARVVSRPEITYIATPRDAGHLNAVVAFDAPDARMRALVAEVAAAHADVASRWMVRGADERPGVEGALADAGYRRDVALHACGIAVAAHRPRATPGIEVRPVLDLPSLRTWVDVGARAFGRPADLDDARLAGDLAHATGPGARVHRFVAWDGTTGAPLAAAGLTAFPALRFGLLWAGATLPAARGRGAYSALVATRIAKAQQLGLEAVGLYARFDTSAPIVAKQGFARHGSMTHWVRAAAGA